MKRIAIAALLAVAAVAGVEARMTDMEVVAYIQTQTAAGKSEQQIGRELVLRGVSPEQVERIKAQYESQGSSQQRVTATASDKINATRAQRNTTRTTNKGTFREDEENDRLNNDEIPTDFNTGALDDIGRQVQRKDGTVQAQYIYGHNVFNEGNLTFAPSENLATPQDYRLGPGDEVVIDVWGENEEHIRQTISPEGSIMVAQLGPIYLNGNTIKDANKLIRDKFARKYSGVADQRSDVNVSLGQVRSIQVDVMGEVSTPGTFRLSPFSTVFHALYNAGGINDIGSMRNIEVLRNGKKIANVDIYDYLFKGKQTGNIRLQEGDVIIVPPYSELVNVEGNVKRPMYYEVRPDETLQTVIGYAGGFTGDAYSDMVRISRRNGRENELLNVEKGDFKNYRLRDGDMVSVGTIRDRYANRVELRGAVMRPGMFALGTDIFTLRDLITKADGLLDDAYTGRVMLYREGPDLSLEVEAIDLGAVMNGTAPDIELKRNDMLVVSSVHELNDRGTLTIQGEVARPGDYPYATNSTVEDLIVQAGGLLQGASTSRVDVARRVVDPTATTPSDQLSQTFTLTIEKGLLVNNNSDFRLMPYDVVTIRRSPGYSVQEFVTVGGEVAFAGPYAIERKNERLSSYVARAGGLTKDAYVRGASLIRKMTEEEISVQQEALDLAMLNATNTTDSISIQKVKVNEYYNVGINLEKAMANSGSQYDVVLRAGDRIFIPEMATTVTISGEVMSPTTTTYEKGLKLKDYVDFAGGYSEQANRKRAYVVYMNGTIRKAKRSTRLEPGCQIIVPTKPIKTGGNTFAEIMGYISSFTSLGVMAASIATMLKK